MSSGTNFTEAGATVTNSDDPHLIEVIAPIESETKDATLAEIRGEGLPGDRATLAQLSAAINQQGDDLRLYARSQARLAAIIFG